MRSWSKTFRPSMLAALALASGGAPLCVGLGLSAVLCAPASAAAQARHHWQRGDVLPAEVLRAGPNVNYAAQRLRRPPDGYGWFSLDGAYLLASLSSGLVVDVAE
ncbi:MAG TPA: RcnB family protein [Caulobacteraceae bacterium]|nr:RcnB family protein [Caulobacteraceae bacterium]